MNIQDIYYDKTKKLQAFIQNPLIEAPLKSSVDIKYDKHQKESEPILSQVLSPFEAFKNGFEKAIASYIKLGQEEIIKNKVISQPQIKSEETLIIEKLIKNLLKDFDSVKFIKKEDRYLAISEGKLYQFSALLERVNFNQINLNFLELECYKYLLDSGCLINQPSLPSIITRPTEEDFDRADPEHLCQALSFAEKSAINIYTGDFYVAMNSLLRGDIEQTLYFELLPHGFSQSAQINHCLKETLLHVVVAVSGLNKLPDYTPSLNAEGQLPKYLYRVENDLPKNILKNRKWAVLKGGGITTEMGFISTSFKKPVGYFLSEDAKVGIMIKNLKGKKITPLSQFGNGEREILLPPTQMQWLYYKDIITDIFRNQMTLFIAKPVTVSPELTLDFVPRSPEDWIVKTLESSENLLLDIGTAIV